MNKTQVIEKIAKTAGLSKAKAQLAVDTLLDTVTAEVKKGKSVTITGFGTFDRGVRKARVARNPQTGESIKVPRTKYPRFKAGATLKQTVKGTKKH